MNFDPGLIARQETDPVDQFRAALFDHGLLYPTGTPGVYGRGAAFEAVTDAVDRLIGQPAVAAGLEAMRFSPVLTQRTLSNSGYIRNFPHYAGTVRCLCGGEDRAEDEGGLALTPASCYPVYPIIAARGRVAAQGCRIDAASYCFRNEPSADPARMQAFRQHEQVFIGTAAQVKQFQSDSIDWASAMFASLGLDTVIEVANDPFYGRTRAMMVGSQRSQKLKFELLCPVSDPRHWTACGSFNYHLDHFGKAFGLTLADGSIAHTGCSGFGIERIALALFNMHGFSRSAWPEPVQAALWP